MVQSITGQAPEYISAMLMYVSEHHERQTKSAALNLLHIPRSHSAYFDRVFSVLDKKLWNIYQRILETALLNLNIHTSYFSQAVKYTQEYVTFWYVLNIRSTNFEILKGTSFSQMSNFRRVKNSHVFVTPVKNSFEFFTCVTNMCEFITRVTDSFECESQTNMSQV